MKNRPTRSYPLLLACASLPFIAMQARAAEKVPPQEIPVQAEKPENTVKNPQEAVAAADEGEQKEDKQKEEKHRGEERKAKDREGAQDRDEGVHRREAKRREHPRADARERRKTDPAGVEKAEPDKKAAVKSSDEAKSKDKSKDKDETKRADRRARDSAGKDAKKSERADKTAEAKHPGKDSPRGKGNAAKEPEVDTEVAKKEDRAVEKTTREVEARAQAGKLNLKDKGAARNMIRDLIGKDSEVSKAEARRENRVRPGAGRDAAQPRHERGRDDLREASAYLRSQLRGNAARAEAPAFFRRPANGPHRGGDADRNHREAAVRAPRYYQEGRRYVPFASRASVPAILLAAAALERVAVQPESRVRRVFVNGDPQIRYANELPPESYRGDDAVVVSYPVSKNSMISSNDIIFAQGSTRFADAHSYDMVLALADAISDPGLADARFVVEGHASAEGSYDDNMRLSQQRAESIVRDMVREGIDPERLIPVGYGESEARYPADAAESLRALDRNVMVFRIGADS